MKIIALTSFVHGSLLLDRGQSAEVADSIANDLIKINLVAPDDGTVAVRPSATINVAPKAAGKQRQAASNKKAADPKKNTPPAGNNQQKPDPQNQLLPGGDNKGEGAGEAGTPAAGEAGSAPAAGGDGSQADGSGTGANAGGSDNADGEAK